MSAIADITQTYSVPAHYCEDNAVRELDGWAFTGYRCALCLRPTRPGGPVRIGDRVVPS